MTSVTLSYSGTIKQRAALSTKTSSPGKYSPGITPYMHFLPPKSRAVPEMASNIIDRDIAAVPFSFSVTLSSGSQLS